MWTLVTNYVENNDALNNFIDGFERSVLLRFNCDGVIIDKNLRLIFWRDLL